MPLPILIIHGWSDSAASFEPLRTFLSSTLQRPVQNINLADWRSLDDAVTYDDLVRAMQDAWLATGLPTDPQSIDVVVHSTGALVLRDWLTTYFPGGPKTSPINRLLMLAPANFGSPLAHKGRSLLGRVIKGFRSNFQTGTHILKGLELASPYTWQLSQRDLFGDTAWYGADGILATVLVGNTGYSGVRSAANEEGGDGTVRISTANLNASMLTIDFSRPAADAPYTLEWRDPSPGTEIAFGIMAGENHATITLGGDDPAQNAATPGLIAEALSIDRAGWNNWVGKLRSITAGVIAPDGYQNLVMRCNDDRKVSIKDYFVEFYENDADRGIVGTLFHRDAIRDVHLYGDDGSYRSIYIDVSQILAEIDKVEDHLDINFRAEPLFGDGGEDAWAGYAPVEPIVVRKDLIESIFVAHRTLLVDVVLKRSYRSGIYKILP